MGAINFTSTQVALHLPLLQFLLIGLLLPELPPSLSLVLVTFLVLVTIPAAITAGAIWTEYNFLYYSPGPFMTSLYIRAVNFTSTPVAVHSENLRSACDGSPSERAAPSAGPVSVVNSESAHVPPHLLNSG